MFLRLQEVLLQEIPNLYKLVVWNVQIYDEAANDIESVLSHSTNLQELWIVQARRRFCQVCQICTRSINTYKINFNRQ